jgi:DNA-binding CsgD family transcriptional regulator
VFLGRRSECEVLDRLLEAVRAGESPTLVLRGEPGVGKSALLDYVAGRSSGCLVARAAGVQSEMELAFAGLHQLCAPMLDRVDRLPAPQRDALGTAFGLACGTAPDRFLVGLAMLGLLSEVADERPLVCLVDDAQWLDRESAQALEFVARRLFADSVGLVFAVRQAGEERPLAGLPELVVGGLSDDEARAVPASVIRWPLDEQVRDQIVAETRGNPLALLELPRGLSPEELAGGFGLPGARGLSGRIEDSFRRRLAALPAATRRLLLVAAAEPVGDPLLVWRAAAYLGIAVEAAEAADSEGFLEFGARVTFRHPLVRSAIYRSASAVERRRVHGALAQATDPGIDPDRRSWHRAQAALGPDGDVASELERSADRARGRGGLAASAAFLERSAALTPEPGRRAERRLAAAQAKAQSGAVDAALGLLATAEAGPLDEVQRARVDLLRAQIAFAVNRGRDAPPLLLTAAKRLEPLDVGLARETYLEALQAAMFVGRLAGGDGLLEVAQAARGAPPPSQPPRPADLLLDGLALLITEGHPAGAPILKQALRAFRSEQISSDEALRWLWLACLAAVDLWDHETWDALSTRHVQLARDAGALSVLPIALISRMAVHLWAGELDAVAALVDEVEAVMDATGSHLAPYGALGLAAWRGRKADAAELIETSRQELVARGEGQGLALIDWTSAVLYNGVGCYEAALHAAQQVGEHPEELPYAWGLVELIEAATRSGQATSVGDALQRLSETTRASGTDWALGSEALARALLSAGEAAERLYREAIDRLGRTRVRVELGRAHLLYGEWLRRERRRLDAREQLRTAHELLSSMGMEGFAERAGRELLATGETARKRSVETSSQLTAQEAQVARLARDGLSNPEIGARLFITSRTVQYHLSKVFTKLGISSRLQLARALPGDAETVQQNEHVQRSSPST